MEGGVDAERKAKEDWREEQKQERLNEMNVFREWQKEHKRLRQEAIAQGRHHISEMTPAEQEARRLEAEKAHNDEQAALSHGVGKLASKYWGLEGQGADQDRLDKAMQALAEEHSKEAEAEAALEMVNGAFELLPPPPASEQDLHAPPQPPTEQEEAEAAAAAATSQLDALEVLEAARKMEELSLQEQEEKRRAEEATRQQRREEEERQQLIAESVRMYKEQLEAERRTGSAGAPKKETWEGDEAFSKSNAAVSAAARAARTELYWTESMDLRLGVLVRDCVFDFEAIASTMEREAAEGRFGIAEQLDAKMLTSECVRLRWSRLDAGVWSEQPPEASALHTTFKAFINPVVASAPTYDRLKSLASGSMPAYLTIPSAFPSMADDSEDEDEEEDVHMPIEEAKTKSN